MAQVSADAAVYTGSAGQGARHGRGERGEQRQLRPAGAAVPAAVLAPGR